MYTDKKNILQLVALLKDTLDGVTETVTFFEPDL